MRKLRLSMLALLCAGLLLCGIGAGVTLAEFSSFTYSGQQLIDGAQDCSQRFTIQLESTTGPVYLGSGHPSYAPASSADMICLETDDSVAPGTLRVDVHYRSVGPEPYVWNDYWEGEEGEWVQLGWYNASELELLLACKDQVLSDIQAHRLGDYIPAELTAVTVCVASSDADRIVLP